MTSPTLDRRQGLVGNTPIKAPVDCATTGNIALSGEQLIDGVQTNASRVLVLSQLDATQNGIWDTSSAAWTRSNDSDGNYDLTTGTIVYVLAGGSLGGVFFQCATPKPITIGSSAIKFNVLVALGALGNGVSVYNFMTPAQVADAKTGAPVLDATAAVQSAINTTGAAGIELIQEGIVLCGQLAVTAPNFRWRGRGNAKILLKPANYGAAQWHVSLSGASPFIRDLTFDGNQFAMTVGQVCNGLLVMATATLPDLDNVTCRAYNGTGCVNYSVNGGLVTANLRRGSWRNCHFDDNAGLGHNLIGACYHDYDGCTFDRNGFGWQATRANYADISHSFGAFGLAVRLRSHHISFRGATFRDNAKDGANTNQGSYAIRYLAALAYGNDDGGFTLAADNTASGLPGEGESCYDVHYTDCEAYNNYTCGIVAYQPAHDVQVIGGRYYNNHRLAGNIAAAASYRHGIYFAAGSTGIKVDVKAYDDRQFRAITAVAGGVLTATGWVPGSMLYYPKVAIYNASQVLQGYGQITAESAGSVTITPTAQGGLVLANITAGMYVTQAVQHSGVTADNNCQGTIDCDGYGHHPSAADGGRNIQSGGFSAGQNILVGREKLEDFELLVNPTWDASTATGWGYSLTGGGATAADTVTCRSAQALSLVAGTSAAQGDASLVAGGLNAILGEFVEFSVWAYALVRGQANIYLFWNPGAGLIATTYTHPGGGWKLMKIGAQIPASTTQVLPRIEAVANATVKWDTASLKAVRSHIDQRETAPTSRYLPV